MATTQELIDILGEDGFENLLIAYGGGVVRVPRTPQEASPINVALGLAAAQALSAAYGGEMIDVPSGQKYRQLQVARLHAEGMSACRIATRLGMSRYGVRCALDRPLELKSVGRAGGRLGDARQLNLPLAPTANHTAGDI
jgi:hypothetical protein